MSPRRMDISSLLRDPSPPPRPPPPSLLSILNSPSPPFLGLDALVHVASEERRRIAAHHDTPQHGNGYRMAGGIQVLSNDPPSARPLFLDDDAAFHRDQSRHFPPNNVDQPPRNRPPFRVWEEQPAARRVSPTRMSDVLPEWPTYSGHVERDRIVEHVPAFSTRKQPLPSHDQPPLSSPMHHRSPIQSESHLPTPRAPPSPVLDLRLQHVETQPELRPECSDTQVGASTITSSVPTVPELALGKAGMGTVVVDTSASSPLEPVQPLLALESVTCAMSTDVSVSQTPSTTPSQHLFPISLSAQSEHSSSPPDMPTSSLVQPEPPSHRSPKLEDTTEQELLQQAMMDVDEELLSLVEDRSVREVPKPQIDSTLPLPVTATGAAFDSPSLVVPPCHPVLKGPLIKDEEKDRASMPPPAARNKKAEKDKANGTGTGSKKKKDGTSKPAAKPKQPPKQRAKPVPKPKAKPSAVDSSSKVGIAKGAGNINARSRSASVIPSAADDVPEPEEHDSDKEDDKLYCVCKTRYDEDRMMIACDRCDEWFHTLCVNMPDQEIDLVDQFICPPCIQKHPHLRTTWKQRCLFGLQHEDPTSAKACHKPSRGVFSKYCSDDCGIKYMQARITQWEKSGGDRDLLWENVKNAAKREGVVVCTVTNGPNPPIVDVDSNSLEHKPRDSVAKRRAEREVARLNARLEEVVKARELMKRELDMVMWREKVVELASERAGKADECGWDQRLCFGEEEWADFGLEVLESYEERVKAESADDAIPLDAVSHGEWWCTGKIKCDRHAGWQKLRAAEVSFDKETKEGTLLKLTASEREIRKCIEDILYPQSASALQAPPYSGVQLNGSEKPPAVGRVRVPEGGKKRSS